MVGVQWRAWGPTLHPWCTGRDLELGCPWTTPLTLCPATTSMDHQGATMTTAQDPHQRLTQVSTGEPTWTIATGTLFVEIHLYVGLACLGFKPSRLCRHSSHGQYFHLNLQTGPSRWLQNSGSKLQSPQQEPAGPLCCSATGMFNNFCIMICMHVNIHIKGFKLSTKISKA